MTKEERLQYCFVCEHKGFTVSKGVFCGLTSEYPSFEKECENYNFSLLEKDKLSANRRSFFGLENNHNKRNNLKYEFRLKKSLIRETRKYDNLKYKHWNELPNEIRFTKNYKIIAVSEIIVFLLFLVIFQLSGVLSSAPNFKNYVIPSLLVFLILNLIYFYIQTKRKKSIIILNEEGIEHHKKGKFKWNEILLSMIETKRGFGDVSYDILILNFVSSFKTIRIPLGNLMSTEKIEHGIELFKEKFETTRHNSKS